MQRIEVISLSISDLQRMLDLAVEKAIKLYQESQKMPSKYEEITLAQAAEELRCCKTTIRRKMKVMGIKPLRVGREQMINRINLERIKKSGGYDKVGNSATGNRASQSHNGNG